MCTVIIDNFNLHGNKTTAIFDIFYHPHITEKSLNSIGDNKSRLCLLKTKINGMVKTSI